MSLRMVQVVVSSVLGFSLGALLAWILLVAPLRGEYRPVAPGAMCGLTSTSLEAWDQCERQAGIR